jgi:hypothetical protein
MQTRGAATDMCAQVPSVLRVCSAARRRLAGLQAFASVAYALCLKSSHDCACVHVMIPAGTFLS